MKKVVGFGDYMLRLNPSGYLKFMQANQFEANFTGAEANVCVSLSYMGVPTALVTRLPENELARCALASLHKYCIETCHISRGGERIGIFYVEKGASQRPSKVIYDRKNSSFATAAPEDFDWDTILKDAGFFHFTGFTPALGTQLAESCKQACMACKRNGITVSCDLNYRSSLWTTEQAKTTMEELLPYVDILIANEEDAEKVLHIIAPNTDIIQGKLSHDGYAWVARQISEKYNIPSVAFTLRQSISASENIWSGLLYTGSKAYFSKEYNIHLVDRVGGGDSFCAGLLYAVGHDFSPIQIIEYATAASCLKQTIELDVNLSSPQDVLALAGGDGSGRVQR